MKQIRLKINSFDDRERLCSLLARNGCKVWEEVKERDIYTEGETEYFVCFEIPKEGR